MQELKVHQLLENPSRLIYYRPKNMDNSVVMALIVGVLTLVGTLAGAWIAFRFASRGQEKRSQIERETDERNWRREQEKAERERLREDQAIELEHIRLLYTSAIQSLAALIGAEEASTTTAEQRPLMIEEIHKTVYALMLRRRKFFDRDTNFSRRLNEFTSAPAAHTAGELRDAIITLAETDEELFPADQTRRHVPQRENGVREVNFYIEEDFRRQLLIGGVEVQQNCSFRIDIANLTPSQRQKLCDMFFESHKTIPRSFWLQIPHVHTGAGKAMNKNWMASLNPQVVKPNQIFDAWERDYERAFAEANQKLQAKAAAR